MSRSRRRTPIAGNAGSSRTSEKDDKKLWHGVMRAAERSWIRRLLDRGEEFTPQPCVNQVSNKWNFNKDGKHYFGPRRAAWWYHISAFGRSPAERRNDFLKRMRK